MSADIAVATIRLSVLANQGRLDLAVPVWADLSLVADSCVEAFGGAPPNGFATTAGRVLSTSQPVSELGLSDGDVLVAVTGPIEAPREHEGGTPPPARRTPTGVGVVAGAAGCAVLAGVFAGIGTHGIVHAACVAALAIFLIAMLIPRPDDHRLRSPFAVGLLPAFGAGVGFAAALSLREGGGVLGVGVAALVALVTAAVLRSELGDERADLLRLWLVAAGIVAALAAICLAAGSSLRCLVALCFGGAVIAARVMPMLVIDVPDRALVDIDRLSVTAWSVREPQRRGRRRTTVKQEGVVALVKRGHRMLTAGTIGVALTVAVTGPVLAIDAVRSPGLEAYASCGLIGVGSAALSLLVRNFRSHTARMVLRAASAWATTFAVLVLISQAGPTVTLWTAIGLVLVGIVVVGVAIAIGRGFRSVWWERVGEIAESLTMVLAIAGIPLACGLFTAVRQMVS